MIETALETAELAPEERRQLAALRRETGALRPRAWRSAAQLASCAVPMALCWWVMLGVGLERPSLTLALAAACGLVMVRLFGIFHDLAHGSVFGHRWLNELCGVVVGLVMLTPFHRWRREHGRHHSVVANLDRRGPGDVPLWTVEEYERSSGWSRLRYRVFRWPPFTFVGGGMVLFFLIMRRTSLEGGSAGERMGVHLTSLWVVALLGSACVSLGPALFALTVVPMYVVLCGSVMWLYNIQHLFPVAYLRRGPAWDYTRGCLEGSSYYRLPPVLRWLSANTGFHHLHHLFPRVPNYFLPHCQARLEQLDVGRRVRPVSLRDSLSIARWGLYDESRRRFVPLTHARAGSRPRPEHAS